VGVAGIEPATSCV